MTANTLCNQGDIMNNQQMTDQEISQQLHQSFLNSDEELYEKSKPFLNRDNITEFHKELKNFKERTPTSIQEKILTDTLPLQDSYQKGLSGIIMDNEDVFKKSFEKIDFLGRAMDGLNTYHIQELLNDCAERGRYNLFKETMNDERAMSKLNGFDKYVFEKSMNTVLSMEDKNYSAAHYQTHNNNCDFVDVFLDKNPNTEQVSRVINNMVASGKTAEVEHSGFKHLLNKTNTTLPDQEMSVYLAVTASNEKGLEKILKETKEPIDANMLGIAAQNQDGLNCVKMLMEHTKNIDTSLALKNACERGERGHAEIVGYILNNQEHSKEEVWKAFSYAKDLLNCNPDSNKNPSEKDWSPKIEVMKQIKPFLSNEQLENEIKNNVNSMRAIEQDKNISITNKAYQDMKHQRIILNMIDIDRGVGQDFIQKQSCMIHDAALTEQNIPILKQTMKFSQPEMNTANVAECIQLNKNKSLKEVIKQEPVESLRAFINQTHDHHAYRNIKPNDEQIEIMQAHVFLEEKKEILQALESRSVPKNPASDKNRKIEPKPFKAPSRDRDRFM